MKVVIVGGVAGGASAAARLRRLSEDAEIVMLERGPYISYANCGLPYYIGGEITDREELTLQTPESFRERFRVDVRVRHQAVRVDPEQKTVTVRSLEGAEEYKERYDKLILSPGAEPVRPGLPGIEDERVFTLRTIPDTYRIEEHIKAARPKSALVVGGGFIGLEMAENLSHAGLSVSVVEFADHVIGPMDADMASEIHGYLRHKGIDLRLKQGVAALYPREKGIEAELSSGDRLLADMVLLSVGVRPDTGFLKDAGLDANARGAIVVDEHMRTSDPHIYAVGDAVEVKNRVTGGAAYVPLAGPANKQGRIAADHISGLDSAYRGTQGSSILKLFDMHIASTGLNEAGARAAGLEYDKVYLSPNSHAGYYPGATAISMKVLFEKPSGRILGAQIVGFEGVDKRCDVLATAIGGGMTGYDLAELELCYAPPFSSAKDPVNMAGFMIENLLSGKLSQFHWHDVECAQKEEGAVLLDVRTGGERAQGAISGSLHIPVDALRDRLSELDPTKTVYVYCQSGVRSYIACRILMQHGFTCHNLSGGYRLYGRLAGEGGFVGGAARACGMEKQ